MRGESATSATSRPTRRPRPEPAENSFLAVGLLLNPFQTSPPEPALPPESHCRPPCQHFSPCPPLPRPSPLSAESGPTPLAHHLIQMKMGGRGRTGENVDSRHFQV